MNEVKWIKICTDIFNDEKIMLIESMPDADALIVIWFKLLCLAGQQNNHGIFMIAEKIPYTDEMFAAIFRRNINTVRLALKTFEQFDMIEIVNGVVTIPRWEKHQNLDALEKKREYQKNWIRNKREQLKLMCSVDKDNNSTVDSAVESTVDSTKDSTVKSTKNSTVESTVDSTVDSMSTAQNKNKNKNIIINNNIYNAQKNLSDIDLNNKSEKNVAEIAVESVENSENEEKTVKVRGSDAEFERLWQLYPRKQGKKEAKKFYAIAVRNGTAVDEIEAGIKRYCEYIRKNGIEKQFIKHGSKWFEGQCWNDEYEDFAAEPQKKPAKEPESYDLNKFDLFANSFMKAEGGK